MTTRRLRFVIVLLSLLGAGVLVAVFIHVRDKRALRAYKAGLLANGEKLTIEELVAASSAEANFAANHLLQAAWMLNQNGPVMPMNQPPAMRFVAPGKAMVGWKQPDIRVEGSRTNRWEELAAQLRDNSETLTQIREELKDGQLDWRLNYRQGFNILLPHLAKMKQIGQWLSAASMNNLHNGNIESAQADGLCDVRLPLLEDVLGHPDRKWGIVKLAE